MEIQLKTTKGELVYPRVDENDNVDNIQLFSAKGQALYPSTLTSLGNCELLINRTVVYPVINGTSSTWNPTNFSIEQAYSGTFYQGVAIFGDYSINFNDNSSRYYIKNIITGSSVSTNNFQDGDSDRHSNTLNFGTKKYADEDTFPLLYGSGNLNELVQTIDVYRLQYLNSSWDIKKIQTIFFTSLQTYSDVAFWKGDIVLKQGKNVLVCKTPEIKDSLGNDITEYTMTDDDVISRHSLLVSYSYPQGYTIVEDYLLSLEMQNSTNNHIVIYNLKTNRQIADFALADKELKIECEQVAYHENEHQFYIFTRNGGAYKINFSPEMPTSD